MENLPSLRIPRYKRRVRLIACLLLVLPLFSVRADWIETKDGKKTDGKILSVTSDSILMEVQISPSIIDQKSFARSEVVNFYRASQDDVAFAEIAETGIPATADSAADYDRVLEGLLRPFMKNYPYSKHMGDARKLMAQLEDERGRVLAGEVKIDGEWSTLASSAGDPETTGRLQLARMKSAANPSAALSSFEQLEKRAGDSTAYAEAVKLARVKIAELRSGISKARTNLDRRLREQAEGLRLASEDQKLLMQQAIDKERATLEAQLAAARQSGSKWIPVLPNSGALEALSKTTEAEAARLEKIDTGKLDSAIALVAQAQADLDAGNAAGAKEKITRANQLWPKYAPLAAMNQKLKSASTSKPSPSPAK